jgi:tetratricopeptide (TPR) repeat protein
MEELLSLNVTMQDYCRDGKNSRLATSMRELTYHSLIAAQKQMDAIYTNKSGSIGESYYDPGMNMVFHFQQRVSEMLPILQANQRYSEIKTDALKQTISSLSRNTDVTERKRTWLAIDRMLNEIELKKSECGYEPFQRSSAGLYTAPGEILDLMQSENARETDSGLIDYSAHIIQNVQEQLAKPLDHEFMERVDESRRLQPKFKEFLFNDVPPDSSSSGISAYNWFSKAKDSTNPDEKIEYLTKAIELYPEFARAYINRGNIFQDKGEFDRAVRDYDKAILLDSTIAAAFFNRGNAYQLLGLYDQSLRDFSKAIELDPKNDQFWLSRATTAVKIGNPDLALEDYTQTIDINPHNGYAFFQQGNIHASRGQFDQAIREYSKAIEFLPPSAILFNNRGNVYRNLHEYQKALQDYSSAIAIDSLYANAFDNRGVIERILRNYRPALQDHQKAIALDGSDANSYYNLGCVYWEMRDYHSAIKSWEKCLKIAPGHKSAKIYLQAAYKRL